MVLCQHRGISVRQHRRRVSQGKSSSSTTTPRSRSRWPPVGSHLFQRAPVRDHKIVLKRPCPAVDHPVTPEHIFMTAPARPHRVVAPVTGFDLKYPGHRSSPLQPHLSVVSCRRRYSSISSLLILCCRPTHEDGKSPDFMRLYTVLVCTLRYLAVSSTVSRFGRVPPVPPVMSVMPENTLSGDIWVSKDNKRKQKTTII